MPSQNVPLDPHLIHSCCSSHARLPGTHNIMSLTLSMAQCCSLSSIDHKIKSKSLAPDPILGLAQCN